MAPLRVSRVIDLKSSKDLCGRDLTLLIMGGLLLGSFLIEWAISYTNTIHPEGIVIHHTSVMPPILHLGASTAARIPMDLNTWDEFHRQRGFGAFYWGRMYHIGYHYIIFPDGTVRKGRPEQCVGAHAKGFNKYLGIAVLGDFSKQSGSTATVVSPEPTKEQMQALVALCRHLRARYNIPLEKVIAHSAVARTECPGGRFPFAELLRQIQ